MLKFSKAFLLNAMFFMTKKPLIATNPYLKDLSTRQRKAIVRQSASSSTAIEGVHFKDNNSKQR